jgi:nucleoside-diphosphate-sugar epimerase
LHESAPADITLLQKDCRDVTSVDLEGVDAVVHLAGVAVGEANLRPASYAINYHAAVDLAGLCKFNNVRRFIYVSSVNHGYTTEPKVDTENLINSIALLDESAHEYEIMPTNLESVLSQMVEQDITRIADHQFAPTFLRCTTSYGYSPALRLDLMVNNLLARAFTTGRVHIQPSQSQRYIGLHVADVAQAIIAVLRLPIPQASRRVFDLDAHSELFHPATVAAAILRVLPTTSVAYEDYPAEVTAAPSTLPTIVGFAPSRTLEQGLSQLCEAFAMFNLTEADLDKPTYYRLSYLLQAIEQGTLPDDLRPLAAEALRPNHQG